MSRKSAHWAPGMSAATKDQLIEDVLELRDRITKLEEGLRFYADKSIYTGRFCNDGDGYFDRMGYEILDDEGATARAVLGAT